MVLFNTAFNTVISNIKHISRHVNKEQLVTLYLAISLKINPKIIFNRIELIASSIENSYSFYILSVFVLFLSSERKD